jgi:hypothetical protein
MRMPRAVAVVMAVVALLAGCGDDGALGDGGAAFAVERPASITAVDPVPVPDGPAVLSVSGRIARTNAGNLLQLDLATLERLRIVSFRAHDEQAEGNVVTFSGVLLSDVLELAGADDGATVLDARALNDYRIEIPVSDLDRYPVMIATRVDGDRMPVERFGPIRVVYPNLDFKLDASRYDERWIWQLASISVR